MKGNRRKKHDPSINDIRHKLQHQEARDTLTERKDRNTINASKNR